MSDFVASADIDITAPAGEVWKALTDPALVRQYFFGTTVQTDWQPGSPITWTGEYEGKTYEDKGEILEVEEDRRLQVTHFSPMTGQPDVPENYHTLTYRLDEHDGTTHVSLTQDNNRDEDEAQRFSATWATTLEGLKRTVEGG